MTRTKLTFEEIQRKAQACGWQIRDLAAMLAIDHPTDMAGPLGDYEADDYRRLGETLLGIDRVLELVGKTPNGFINREALDAMEREVRWAEEILAEEWVREELMRADEVLGRPTIPF